MIAVFPSNGKQIIVYRQATAHHSATTYGIIVSRVSTDGTSWSNAATVEDQSGSLIDLIDIGGGVTAGGRIVIFYGRYDPSVGSGGPGYVVGNTLYYRYSDDQGATWSTAGTTFGSGANYGFTGAAIGPMIAIGSGKLLKNYYAWSSLVGGTKAEYVSFSSDGGATWGGDVLVTSDSTVQWDESAYVYLGSNAILGLSRISNGTTFKQTLSTDNGATWSVLGDTTFDSWATPNPCWLLSSARGIECIYVNRTTGALNRTTASAAALIASGVSAWSPITTLIEGWSEPDSGYTTATVLAPGTVSGWAYNGRSASVADIVLFSYPPRN